MSRIVETDNFDGDYPNESFLLGNMSRHAAMGIARAINNHLSGPNDRRYWKVVDDGYKLQPGFEP